MKKKIFKLTAKELKVLRAGKQTAGGAAGCNGASWSASAARTGAGKVAPGRPKPKVSPIKPRAAIKK